MTTLQGPRARISVDRSSALPLYAQLEQDLTARIEAGEWAVQEQIPTELELGAQYGISRTVVRQTLDQMVRKGLLYRRRGKGSFVAAKRISERWIQQLSGFYEDMVAQGHRPVTQVLQLKVLPADENVASRLAIQPGESVIVIERLRSIEGADPIMHVVTYIPYALCPELVSEDLTNISLYRVLESKYGLAIKSGRRMIEALAAPKDAARLLNVPRGSPLVKVESVTYLTDGTPLEYFRALHRADRCRFEVAVLRLPDASPLDSVTKSEFPGSMRLVME